MGCPKCRSDNVVQLSEFTPRDVDRLAILMRCGNCSCEWEELWVFDHISKINDVEI